MAGDAKVHERVKIVEVKGMKLPVIFDLDNQSDSEPLWCLPRYPNAMTQESEVTYLQRVQGCDGY